MEKGTPEKYVRIVKHMYESDDENKKQCGTVGVNDLIPVRIGLHQESALSPYLFDIINVGTELLTENVRKDNPQCLYMMFADDIVCYCCGMHAAEIERKKVLEENVGRKRIAYKQKKTIQLRFGKERSDKIHVGGSRTKQSE